MARPTIFDRYDQYGVFSEVRKAFLDGLLHELMPALNLKTALDVGCGVGVFSDHLRAMGLAVVGVDGRPENVAEARARYPELPFHAYDVEDPAILEVSPRDMVLCFGLLYHLENPFRAIRHLYALTGEILLVESRVIPSRRSLAALVEEDPRIDAALRYVAFVPSESCLVAMLYRAGFAVVYKPERFPDHDEFRSSPEDRRRRTILIAMRSPLTSASLRLVADRPLQNPQILWKRSGWSQPAFRLLRFMRKPWKEKLATVRDLSNRW